MAPHLALHNLDTFFAQGHPLDQQLHDALAFSWKQLLPDPSELAQWQHDFWSVDFRILGPDHIQR